MKLIADSGKHSRKRQAPAVNAGSLEWFRMVPRALPTGLLRNKLLSSPLSRFTPECDQRIPTRVAIEVCQLPEPHTRHIARWHPSEPPPRLGLPGRLREMELTGIPSHVVPGWV